MIAWHLIHYRGADTPIPPKTWPQWHANQFPLLSFYIMCTLHLFLSFGSLDSNVCFCISLTLFLSCMYR